MEASVQEYSCVICGTRLFPPGGDAACSFCGRREKADYVCPEGHYVCEACRLASAAEIIEKTCAASNETDPLQLAILLMKHPAIPLHGSENHLVAAYSLLTAARNTGEVLAGTREFHETAQRVKGAAQGICGSWGVCGCAIAAGAVTSIITGATYLSDIERSRALRVGSKILDKIARIGGPRCCKMSTYAAIAVASECFTHALGIPVRTSPDLKPCIFSKSNTTCIGRRCPYYGKR